MEEVYLFIKDKYEELKTIDTTGSDEQHYMKLGKYELIGQIYDFMEQKLENKTQ